MNGVKIVLMSAIYGGAIVATGYVAQAQFYGGGWVDNRASTVGESYSRGMADVIRSQGERNLNNSVAAGNFEAARSQYLDNRVKSVETYWARRDIYNQRMAEESYARQQSREAFFARTLLQPLSDSQFDPTTGQIQWPILCREKQFDDFRSTIDEAFAQLATSGLLSMSEFTAASNAIRDFRGVLQQNRDNYPQQTVATALRFLINLNRELESQVG